MKLRMATVLIAALLIWVLNSCVGNPQNSATPPRSGTGALPSPADVIAANTDLWGDAALHQLDGPSYEFFEKLLPPLRYVDADFRCYPLVLSAPNSPIKGRIVSDGSAINALTQQ